MTIKEDEDGTLIMISFTGTDGKLEIRGSELSAMEVLCNGEAAGFNAHAEGGMLMIRLNNKCKGELEVRFARTGWYLVNLYNSAGVPAVPFVMKAEV